MKCVIKVRDGKRGKEKETKSKCDVQKTVTNIVDIDTTTSITLNMKGLNILILKCHLKVGNSDCDFFFKDSIIDCLKEKRKKLRDSDRLIVRKRE